MAALGASLPAIFQMGGTVMAATGYMDAAKATQVMAQRRSQSAEFAATQLEQQAGQETAAGQAAALEQRRQGRLIGSDILAKAAMSGGASDPGIVNLIAKNAGESSYRASLAAYEGLSRARQSRLQAASQRYGAELGEADAGAAASSLRTRAFSTALTGAGTMYEKYWAAPESPSGWTSGYDLPMGR